MAIQPICQRRRQGLKALGLVLRPVVRPGLRSAGAARGPARKLILLRKSWSRHAAVWLLNGSCARWICLFLPCFLSW